MQLSNISAEKMLGVSGASVDLTSYIIYKPNIYLKELCISLPLRVLSEVDSFRLQTMVMWRVILVQSTILFYSAVGIQDESLIMWAYKKAFR